MILDIFYNEIVPEASRGNIECYFRYNILFETNILGNQNVADGLEDTSIPVLNIKDKAKFDSLLEKYVEKCLTFYDYSEEPDLKDKIKKTLALLWSNATYEDFNDPINFLRKRIAFFDFSLEPKEVYISSLESNLSLSLNKSNLENETPYYLSTELSNGTDKYFLPNIYFGIDSNKAYIYAIQNKGKNDNNFYQKRLKRTLYSLDYPLDVKNETFLNYDVGNLKDVTPSFLLALNILMGVLKQENIQDIVAISFLPSRWNSKVISHDIRRSYKKLDDNEFAELRNEHLRIQSNLTEKFIRTFLRLCFHNSGLNVSSYPDLDFNLELKLNDGECNNLILAETFDSLDKKKGKI